jgi:hypothetical protein
VLQARLKNFGSARAPPEAPDDPHPNLLPQGEGIFRLVREVLLARNRTSFSLRERAGVRVTFSVVLMPALIQITAI